MTTAPRPQLKVYFDGGCRPNPGRLEAAVVVRGVTHLFDDLGYGTSSDAEWMALISALNLTQALGLERIQFVGDSLEVVRQANRALTSGQVSNGRCRPVGALSKYPDQHQNCQDDDDDGGDTEPTH